MKRIKITRHVVIVAVCALILVATGAELNKAWNKRVAKEQAAQAQQASQATTAQRKHAETVSQEQANINDECIKEAKYYSLLTPVQKKNLAVPACATIRIEQ